MIVLKISDIHTYYGESHVLQGISLEVKKGEVVTILGRNGVGKTTLVHSIIGFVPVRQGEIFFKNTNVTNIPTYKIARMNMGLVPQGRRIFSSLTVKENITVPFQVSGGHQWDMEKIFTIFPSLKTRTHHKGSELSGGEQQMLCIARALISNPVFILMDEPTEGLAPVLAQGIGDIILKLKEEGLSILIVEQNLIFATRVGMISHVMSKGRIVHSSTGKELWANQEIKSKYLGV
jgi:branched-chain amino acid transport system ATP-binding protein